MNALNIKERLENVEQKVNAANEVSNTVASLKQYIQQIQERQNRVEAGLKRFLGATDEELGINQSQIAVKK